MVFSSHLFFYYFLPLALLVYHALPLRGKHISLTLFSYVFYGWANPWFVALMFFQTIVDYIAGLVIANAWNRPPGTPIALLQPGGPRTDRQKAALAVAILSNLALLAFFKYFNFGVDNYNALMRAAGLEGAVWESALRVTLPLGISFYTFQSMSYSIDVYRGDAKAIGSLLDYSCYVAMFPQLVAGPIVRFQDVASQFEERTHTLEKFARGVAFVSFGLAKKVLIANPCGKVADTVFDAAGRPLLEAWYGLAAYAFQIYFDFSAYSDMAIGLGLMLGFVFAKNFDDPYSSKSLTEFWRRWHLSLSTWLRDNLYIPLGGSRRGEVRTYFNLAAVMLLGGLWHGASWNFVIWGGIHGGVLALERLCGGRFARVPALLKHGYTLFVVLIAWIFFRTPDLHAATAFLSDLFALRGAEPPGALLAGLVFQPYYVLTFALAALATWTFPQTWDFTRRISGPKAALSAAVLLLALLVLEAQSFNPFIYFIF